jgi:hypothetical protein
MVRPELAESPLGLAIKKRQRLAALALFFSSQAREVLGDEKDHLAMTRTMSKHLLE